MFLITLLVAAASCTPITDTRGHGEKNADLSQLVIGQSGSDDVAALLGSPSAQSDFGGKSWYYITEKKETRGMFAPEIIDQQVIKISFDANDRVTAISDVNKDKSRAVEYVEKTTPTEGRHLSFMEQMMGNLGRFNAPGRQIDPRNLGR